MACFHAISGVVFISFPIVTKAHCLVNAQSSSVGYFKSVMFMLLLSQTAARSFENSVCLQFSSCTPEICAMILADCSAARIPNAPRFIFAVSAIFAMHHLRNVGGGLTEYIAFHFFSDDCAHPALFMEFSISAIIFSRLMYSSGMVGLLSAIQFTFVFLHERLREVQTDSRIIKLSITNGRFNSAFRPSICAMMLCEVTSVRKAHCIAVVQALYRAFDPKIDAKMVQRAYFGVFY
nr:MAG TPA: hypothetical protein [Bacteriophage sp.]